MGIHVWRLVAHHEEADMAIQRCKESSRIAIGWGKTGALGSCSADATEIARAIRASYPDLNNAHIGGPSLLRFAHQIRTDDLVIISDGVRRRAVMKVLGEYQWNRDWSPVSGGDYWHHRRAEFYSAESPEELWRRAGGAVAEGENIRWPLVRLHQRLDI